MLAHPGVGLQNIILSCLKWNPDRRKTISELLSYSFFNNCKSVTQLLFDIKYCGLNPKDLLSNLQFSSTSIDAQSPFRGNHDKGRPVFRFLKPISPQIFPRNNDTSIQSLEDTGMINSLQENEETSKNPLNFNFDNKGSNNKLSNLSYVEQGIPVANLMSCSTDCINPDVSLDKFGTLMNSIESPKKLYNMIKPENPKVHTDSADLIKYENNIPAVLDPIGFTKHDKSTKFSNNMNKQALFRECNSNYRCNSKSQIPEENFDITQQQLSKNSKEKLSTDQGILVGKKYDFSLSPNIEMDLVKSNDSFKDTIPQYESQHLHSPLNEEGSEVAIEDSSILYYEPNKSLAGKGFENSCNECDTNGDFIDLNELNKVLDQIDKDINRGSDALTCQGSANSVDLTSFYQKYFSQKPIDHDFDADTTKILDDTSGCRYSFSGLNNGESLDNCHFDCNLNYRDTRHISSSSQTFDSNILPDLDKDAISSAFYSYLDLEPIKHAVSTGGKDFGKFEDLKNEYGLTDHCSSSLLQQTTEENSRSFDADKLYLLDRLSEGEIQNCTMPREDVDDSSVLMFTSFHDDDNLESVKEDLPSQCQQILDGAIRDGNRSLKRVGSGFQISF